MFPASSAQPARQFWRGGVWHSGLVRGFFFDGPMTVHSALGDYFSLFKLPRRFALTPSELEAALRDVQGKVHPDRFAHLPENERRVSMQWAAHANEAYRTLRRPVTRALYLLELAGVASDLETNTVMPPDFLMRQMLVRESVEEALNQKDVETLDMLASDIRAQAKVLERELAHDYDEHGDLDALSRHARQLMFLERLREEIDNALATLEG